MFDTLEDRTLARQAASASIVLLANDGVLPLQSGARVAVLGPSADDPRLLLGDYHFPAHLELQHEEAALSPVGSEFTALPPQNPTPTPLEALRHRVEIVDDVEQADVAVVFVGGRSGLTRADTSGEFRDAADLRLAAEQLTLIAETSARGVPVVVVVIGGRAHSLDEVVPHANALVLGWLPGEEGGNALADVLCGEVDASGRLPVSLLHTVGQVGVHSGAHHGGGRSMILSDYVDTPATPLFPFGHGLSYTTWERSDLAVEATTTTDDVLVAVTVTNTGGRRERTSSRSSSETTSPASASPRRGCSASNEWSARPARRPVSRSACRRGGWGSRARTCATVWSPVHSPLPSETSARR